MSAMGAACAVVRGLMRARTLAACMRRVGVERSDGMLEADEYHGANIVTPWCLTRAALCNRERQEFLQKTPSQTFVPTVVATPGFALSKAYSWTGKETRRGSKFP